MREILFRGKTEIGNVWREGYYIKREDIYGNVEHRIVQSNGAFYVIITETLGQYTGLNDKNGKKIFEGDILSARFDDLFPENETRVYVLWREASWNIHQRELGENGYEILDNADEWEIIGNIHDNPELLEVEEIR